MIKIKIKVKKGIFYLNYMKNLLIKNNPKMLIICVVVIIQGGYWGRMVNDKVRLFFTKIQGGDINSL